MTKIIIEIDDKPIEVPTRKDAKMFFPSNFKYQIRELPNEFKSKCGKVTHCGTTGCMSLKQIEEEFKKILWHLVRNMNVRKKEV